MIVIINKIIKNLTKAITEDNDENLHNILKAIQKEPLLLSVCDVISITDDIKKLPYYVKDGTIYIKDKDKNLNESNIKLCDIETGIMYDISCITSHKYIIYSIYNPNNTEEQMNKKALELSTKFKTFINTITNISKIVHERNISTN